MSTVAAAPPYVRPDVRAFSYRFTRDKQSWVHLQSNFIGTEFQILDGGERAARRTSPLKRQGSFLGGPRHQLPAAARADSGESRADSPEEGGRSELGLVQYHMNVMGTKGPRKMVIGVPYVDFDTNVPVKWGAGTRMSRCALYGRCLGSCV